MAVVSVGTRGPRFSPAALHHPAVRMVGRRLALGAPLLFIVSALSFILVSLTPGNAARYILGQYATPGEYEKLRQALGLDRPLYDQYGQWLKHAVAGNFGTSLVSGESVNHVILQRLPVTLSLLLGSLLVTLIIGAILGVVSAARGGLLGRFVDGLALVGFALPAFWVGAELIVLFAVDRTWFPATGYVPFSQSPAEWLRSITLPVLALSLGSAASVAKQTREAMLDVLSSEHIRVARANGVPARTIYLQYALKHAAMRIVTVLGLQGVSLLGATVLVENVFALPGLGTLIVGAAQQHDLPVVQGLAVWFTAMVVVINLTVDVSYAWLNPKLRF